MTITPPPIRILVVDDQALIRQGFIYILGTQSDFQVVAQACDGREAVSLAAETKPDVILMDIRMPNANGIEAMRAILQADSAIKIILLTTFDDEAYVFEGIRAGAVGYLLKDASTGDLFDAIRAVRSGQAVYRTCFAAKMISQAVSHSRQSSHETVQDVASESASNDGANLPVSSQQETLAEPLTEREVDVLQQMAYGKRNTEIATSLFISEGTVKTHVHRILQKLNVEDRTQAVVYALRCGLVH